MKNDLKQLIPILPLVLSLVWMIATAKADQTFWPYLQASMTKDKWQIVNMDKLADCVAWHETKMCTDPNSPTANSRNNCVGIMEWPDGKRRLKTFPTIKASLEAFKSLWVRKYGSRIPTLEDAKKYSGEKKYRDWHNNVLSCYNKL